MIATGGLLPCVPEGTAGCVARNAEHGLLGGGVSQVW